MVPSVSTYIGYYYDTWRAPIVLTARPLSVRCRSPTPARAFHVAGIQESSKKRACKTDLTSLTELVSATVQVELWALRPLQTG